MNKLYHKNPLWFSLVWIALYVVLFSLADNLSRSMGTEKLFTAPLGALFTAAAALWISKNGLTAYFGLRPTRGKPSEYLYFLPLVLLGSVNLWNGVTLRFPPLETVLYALSMLCVGFIEEILFRGFLFRALCRDGMKSAVAISSLTFGLGHIVNLANGAALLPTLLQICYACAIGFLFTVLFLRGGSLIPCVLTHCAINTLSAVAVEPSETFELATAAALTAMSIGYALFILRRTVPESV